MKGSLQWIYIDKVGIYLVEKREVDQTFSLRGIRFIWVKCIKSNQDIENQKDIQSKVEIEQLRAMVIRCKWADVLKDVSIGITNQNLLNKIIVDLNLHLLEMSVCY